LNAVLLAAVVVRWAAVVLDYQLNLLAATPPAVGGQLKGN
jgi:hypothetical protein